MRYYGANVSPGLIAEIEEIAKHACADPATAFRVIIFHEMFKMKKRAANAKKEKAQVKAAKTKKAKASRRSRVRA